ncbi:hypothetical protein CCR95_17780 [Thiocystis minor]|uniref:DUF4124 domain-containing protein n=1 Tax=Thiocystis minor TaxID=61597 RepID=UPI00191292D1|nr:DUF4124 domain-containing protein [Thiocystis minor]MBK5965876.1 hypothetical protein [Thiocystis minor]
MQSDKVELPSFGDKLLGIFFIKWRNDMHRWQLVIPLFFMSYVAYGSSLYKCKDENGVVTFSDKKCGDKAQEAYRRTKEGDMQSLFERGDFDQAKEFAIYNGLTKQYDVLVEQYNRNSEVQRENQRRQAEALARQQEASRQNEMVWRLRNMESGMSSMKRDMSNMEWDLHRAERQREDLEGKLESLR